MGTAEDGSKIYVTGEAASTDIRIGVGRLLIRHLGHIAGELGGNAAVADFLEADAGLSSQAGNGQGHDQANGEHHRKHFVENRRFFHMYTLLFPGFGLVIRTLYPSKRLCPRYKQQSPHMADIKYAIF